MSGQLKHFVICRKHLHSVKNGLVLKIFIFWINVVAIFTQYSFNLSTNYKNNLSRNKTVRISATTKITNAYKRDISYFSSGFETTESETVADIVYSGGNVMHNPGIFLIYYGVTEMEKLQLINTFVSNLENSDW